MIGCLKLHCVNVWSKFSSMLWWISNIQPRTPVLCLEGGHGFEVTDRILFFYLSFIYFYNFLFFWIDSFCKTDNEIGKLQNQNFVGFPLSLFCWKKDKHAFWLINWGLLLVSEWGHSPRIVWKEWWNWLLTDT